MSWFYFKAVDSAGHKTTGKIEAADRQSAMTELSAGGLNPYLVRDLAFVKRLIQNKRRRRKVLTAAGVAVVVGSLMLSVVIVVLGGRNRAPASEVREQPQFTEKPKLVLSGSTKEERAFAEEVHLVWKDFTNDAITKIDVKKLLMTIYLSGRIGRLRLEPGKLEALATSSVKALQQEFRGTACTLLVVVDGETVLEVIYSGLTKELNLRTSDGSNATPLRRPDDAAGAD